MVLDKFQSWGVLLVWIKVGQGPSSISVGAGRGCLDIFFLSIISFRSSFLWETVEYRLKYFSKGRLVQKQPPSQPSNMNNKT